MAPRLLAQIVIACAILLVLLAIIPAIGGTVHLLPAIMAGPWSNSSTDAVIFWQTRIPRVILAALVGASLSVSGVVFQAILRNALAEPYILGISGGAAFGKMMAVLIGLSGSVVMLTFTPLLCFAGALIPLVLLHSISVRDYRFSSVTMLLGGVMLNVFFASVILMMQYFVDFTQVRQMFLWSMGALDIVGYRELLFIGPAAVVIMLLIGTQSRAMNLLSIDHVTAAHLGVNVRRSVGVLLWSGAILTSLAVAVSGPIGFVGLIVPHSIRLVFSSDNRVLLPLSAIYGAIFLLFCDALGWRGMELLQQAGLPITQTAEIPVGVITALLGGPFFLYLLVSRKTGTTMM